MKKTLIGTVVSDKMQNTAIVEVALWKKHRILGKRYQTHGRFMAHNENNIYKMGQTVEIEESRPLSKNKTWIITREVTLSTEAKAKKGKKA